MKSYHEVREMFYGKDDSKVNGFILGIGFKQLFTSKQTYYLVTTFDSLVASIGGNLGLFLGISLLPAFQVIFRLVQNVFDFSN